MRSRRAHTSSSFGTFQVCLPLERVWRNERGTCPPSSFSMERIREHVCSLFGIHKMDKWLPSVGTPFTFLFGRDHIPLGTDFLRKKIRLNGRCCYVITISHLISIDLNLNSNQGVFLKGSLLGSMGDRKWDFLESSPYVHTTSSSFLLHPKASSLSR